MACRGFGTLLLLASGVLAFALPAQAQRELPPVSGPWSPEGVTAVFPEEIGDYVRDRIVEYGAEDWSVGYELASERKIVGAVTVYLYRSSHPAGCAAEFAGAKAVIEHQRSADKLVDTRAPSPLGGRADAAQLARYRFKLDRAGGSETVTSEVYVYCRSGSKWTIKYRATWDAAEDHAAAAPMILRAVGWGPGLAE